jgi:hypothetical protein
MMRSNPEYKAKYWVASSQELLGMTNVKAVHPFSYPALSGVMIPAAVASQTRCSSVRVPILDLIW